jgi:hypothetical protein
MHRRLINSLQVGSKQDNALLSRLLLLRRLFQIKNSAGRLVCSTAVSLVSATHISAWDFGAQEVSLARTSHCIIHLLF